MSMLVGVRGQTSGSEGVTGLREGIVQQPGPFYNGNPSSIIWGNSPTAPHWRDSASATSFASPFSIVQASLQEKEKEKEAGIVAGEGRTALKGRRRNQTPVARHNTPASSPFSFGFPPQPPPGPRSSSDTPVPSVGVSFVSFGSSSNDHLAEDLLADVPEERIDEMDDGILPTMANLVINEPSETNLIFNPNVSNPLNGAVKDVPPQPWDSGSDLREKLVFLGLNGSPPAGTDHRDSSGFFVFGAKTSSGGTETVPQQQAAVMGQPGLLRPRPVKVKRNLSAMKGKGIAAVSGGFGAYEVPSDVLVEGSHSAGGNAGSVRVERSHSASGECSFSSPTSVQNSRAEVADPLASLHTLSSSLPTPAAFTCSSDTHRPVFTVSSATPLQSGRHKSVANDPGVHSVEESDRSHESGKSVSNEGPGKSHFEGYNFGQPSAFRRVVETEVVRDDYSNTDGNLDESGVDTSAPIELLSEIFGKHEFLSGDIESKPQPQPVESSGRSRHPHPIGVESKFEEPNTGGGLSGDVAAATPDVSMASFKVPGSWSRSPLPEHATCRKEDCTTDVSLAPWTTGASKPTESRTSTATIPRLEPFIFGASKLKVSNKFATPESSAPFTFTSKGSTSAASLSSSTGGGCVSRNSNISVSELLSFKGKSFHEGDKRLSSKVETDGVTSSFSTFNLGSTIKATDAGCAAGGLPGVKVTTPAFTPFACGLGAKSSSVDDENSRPAQFVFSAGSGSATSPVVSSSGRPGTEVPPMDGKDQEKKDSEEHFFNADMNSNAATQMPGSGECQQVPQGFASSTSSSSFEFRASHDHGKISTLRKKKDKKQHVSQRRQGRSTMLRDKKGAAETVGVAMSMPDDAGSPMDFSPRRSTPPHSYSNVADTEFPIPWVPTFDSGEVDGPEGGDDWIHDSEVDIAVDNLRGSAGNLSLGNNEEDATWEGVSKGENWWGGKENSPRKVAGRNGKWKRASFDENHAPFSYNRENSWADTKMESVTDDSIASSSNPSLESNVGNSVWGRFTFTAGCSPNPSSTSSMLRRHARRIQRDRVYGVLADLGKTAKSRGDSNSSGLQQDSMGNGVAGSGGAMEKHPVFVFDAVPMQGPGEGDKVELGRAGAWTTEQSRGAPSIFTARSSSWSESAISFGSLPRETVRPSSPSSAAGAEQACERWRLRGNQAYANGDFPKAEEYYSRGASSVPPTETSQSCIRASMLCYSNRAATRMVVGRVREALADCMRAMAVDPNFLRVRLRAASCHLALGEIEPAVVAFKECLRRANEDSQDGKISLEASEGLRKAMQVEEYLDRASDILANWTSSDTTASLRLLNEALLSSPHSERALELKSRSFLLLRRYDEVVQLCEQSLASAERNHAPVGCDTLPHSGSHSLMNSGDLSRNLGWTSPLRIWRWQLMSKAKFQLGRLEEALELLQKLEEVAATLSVDKINSNGSSPVAELFVPSIAHTRNLLRHKAAGNEAFQAGKHSEAVEHYTAALACNGESRPFNAVCFCNRAAASQALGNIADAIADCSRAIALDPKYAKAISRRSTLHEKVRDYGQSFQDLRRLITLLESQQQQARVLQAGNGRPSRSMNSTQDLRQARERLDKIEDEIKKGHPLDHYMILGLDPSCSINEIKKAYRKAALRHHPDKAGQFLTRGDGGDDVGLWKEVGDEVRRDAERLFKLIGEAYAILSDQQKRTRYDAEEEFRKLRTRVISNAGLADMCRSSERGTGRRTRERWDSWTGFNHHQQRWQSGPDAAQPDTYARRTRYGSNNNSRNTGDGGRWTTDFDWDEI